MRGCARLSAERFVTAKKMRAALDPDLLTEILSLLYTRGRSRP